MKKMLIIVFSIVLAGCGDQPGEKPVEQNFTIPFKGAPTESQKAQISTAAQTMFQLCPSLLGYMPDVTIKEGLVQSAENHSESRDYGWKEFVEITLVVNKQLTVIPREFYAAGHACYFRMNGAELTVSKTPCAKLCKGGNVSLGADKTLFLKAQ